MIGMAKKVSILKKTLSYGWNCTDDQIECHCIMAIIIGQTVDGFDLLKMETDEHRITNEQYRAIKRFDCGIAGEKELEIIKQIAAQNNVEVEIVDQ